MTDTTHLGLPFIDGSQAQKHVTHNEALRILDSVVQIGVLDTDRTAPPLTPAEGDRHIVASGATGAWAGHAKAVAVREDGAWRFFVPKLGWCAWSDADGVLLVYDGTAWTEVSSGGGMSGSVTQLGVNDTASAPNLLTVKSNAALFNAVAVAGGGTGDMRVQISKESGAKTASVVFSDAFSGRAEFGLAGSDDFKLKVSSDGTAFVEAITIDQSSGNAAFQRGLLLTGVISPPQITSNQNDYAPTGFLAASTLRLSSDASRNITGLAGGTDGRVIVIHNVGAQGLVLTDQDSASTAANRFLFGASVTLAANAALSLRYDGTTQRWRPISPVSSGGGGSAAGMTDTERRNSLLALIYQSKSFAESRRLVNAFATGFKGASDTLNGILTGSSSGYTVTPGTVGVTTGNVAPTTAAGADQTATHSGATASGNTASASGELAGGFQAWRAFDKVIAHASAGQGTWISNTTTTGWLQYQFGSAKTIAVYTLTSPANSLQARMASAWTLKGSNTGAFAGEETTLDTRSGQSGWAASGETRSYSIASPAPFTHYRLIVTANNGDSLYVEIDEMTLQTGTVTSNMTIVTVAQAADSAVSNARVLIEYDNTSAPVLNMDLTVEVTCNGGTNWTSATLSAVTSCSQGGRKVAETADTACTSGTDFRVRIKTLNNKNVPIHGVSVTVH